MADELRRVIRKGSLAEIQEFVLEHRSCRVKVGEIELIFEEYYKDKFWLFRKHVDWGRISKTSVRFVPLGQWRDPSWIDTDALVLTLPDRRLYGILKGAVYRLKPNRTFTRLKPIFVQKVITAR